MYALGDVQPDWLSNTVAAVTQLYANKKIIQAQAARVAQGQQPVALPPLSPTATPLPAPAPVQYEPALLDTRIPLPSTNTILMVGGAAAALVLAAMALTGRRRRR